MFKRIELTNFRRHEHFHVSCRERNIFVGANNAGKSSILDALRLFADVQRFAERRVPRLQSYDGLGVGASYDMANSNFSVTLENIATNYSSEYSEVVITNFVGDKLYIRINPYKKPNVFVITERRLRTTKSFFGKCFPSRVVVVPTLGQFEDGENFNSDEYVRSIEYTRLAARNFRNIWYRKGNDEFQKLRELVRQNWAGIDISKPERTGVPAKLIMFYSEDNYEREIYWAGFGFQAWLQMMTHFLRGEGNDILVLDEPDIYLHADLQRRLYHIAKRRFGQVFIATHSPEIMNEANPSDVVLIRNGARSGSRITSESGYRNAHALLGSSENADFARLARARRVIAFEGSDRSIYRRFERLLRENGVLSDPDTLSIKIGGYENWHRVDNLSWLFREVFGVDARIFAVFDRDYRCDEEINEFESKLKSSGVSCHVLRRKEIENYLIEERALLEAIRRAAYKRCSELESSAILEILESVAEIQKDDCLISVMSSTTKFFDMKRDRRDNATILKEVKSNFDNGWDGFGFKCRIGGKSYLAELNGYLRRSYGFNITTSSILDAFKAEYICSEMKELITEINMKLTE